MHKWHKFHELTLDNYVEALKSQGYSPREKPDGGISSSRSDFNKTYILVMVCEKCGKMKTLREETDYD